MSLTTPEYQMLLMARYPFAADLALDGPLSVEALLDQINDYYESIIGCMPGNVYWLDANGIAQGCNKNVLNMFGFQSIEQFRGLNFQTMGDKGGWSVESTDAFQKDSFEVIRTGKAKLGIEEPPIYHADGRILYFLTSRVPLFDAKGRVIGMVGISIDITERKLMEQALIKAKEAADAASQAKTMFLANMSHDLKTPLAGIISTAEYLSQSLQQSEAKSRANDIVQSGLRLLELLVEIIEVSRLDSKVAPELSNFNPQVLISDIMQLIKPVIVNKNLVFKTLYQDNIPSLVTGDRWHLYRIILNLLSNAIKFTSEGSIILMVLLEKRDDADIVLKIIVKDTGIGIPLDKQTVIFEQFTRLTNAYDAAYKGTGLGLYIVKTFVESMQGQIQVESQEGKGSTFTCLIPLQCTSPASVSNVKESYTETLVSAKQTMDMSGPINESDELFAEVNVLLVEDNLIAARATKDILQSLGCSVDAASSGQDALRLFKQHTYHFIYLDIGLPDMNGRDVSQALRQMNTCVPIVALSAHIDETIKAECLAAGMSDVLTKPLLRQHAKQNMQAYLHSNEAEMLGQMGHPSVSTDKVIDLDLAASILGCDHAGAENMLAMIMEQLPDYHQAIADAYQQGDRQRLAKAAHKLYGGLVYGGVMRLQKAVAALEHAAPLVDDNALQKCYDEYQLQLVRLNEMYAMMYVG